MAASTSFARRVVVSYVTSGLGAARRSHLHRCIVRNASSTAQAPSKARFELAEKDAELPQGYVATGLHCGIKKDPEKYDLGILLSTQDANAAACFTRNVFPAAPVIVSRRVLAEQNGRVRALVVNSGCANAVTGAVGMEHAEQMSAAMQQGDQKALVMSTGVIGQHLPIRRLLGGIESAQSTLSSSFAAWQALSKSFMTTDTFYKLRTRSFALNGRKYRMAGIDKGAGMIGPHMIGAQVPHATLLALIATDAPVKQSALQGALSRAVDDSFNCISVDGAMSTNDTIIALANGAAGGDEISTDSDVFPALQAELTLFCEELASLVVRDGEGATKFVEIVVKGAVRGRQAKKLARHIAYSPLVKTALYGQDANWGRIISAIGAAARSQGDDKLDLAKICVSFVPSDGSEPLILLDHGEPQTFDEARAIEILKLEDLEISVNLGLGSFTGHHLTCDLSHEYVSINADYRS